MKIKIGEISRRSGVAASTIRYYVQQGLLPAPERINSSMAYYDESCIELLKAIKQLQETRYYPLGVIKNILRRMQEGLSLSQAQEIEDAVFSSGDKPDLIDKHEFIKASGLNERQLKELLRLGILMPYSHHSKRNLYNQEDVEFGRDILKPLLDMGLEPSDMEFYVSLGRQIQDHEQNLRKKLVRGRSKDENIAITVQVSRKANLLRAYIMKRLFQRRVEANIEKSLK